MNRNELIKLVAKLTGLSFRQGKEAVEAVLSAIEEALSRGEQVNLVGFGSFSVYKQPPRPGCDPRTGEPIRIPEKTLVRFKPGKSLTGKIT